MSSRAHDSGEPEPPDETPAIPVEGSSVPVHRPVMLREVMRFLDLRPGLTVVDGTVGGGGHSARILEQILPGGKLIGLDRDPMMIRLAARTLAGSGSAPDTADHSASGALRGTLRGVSLHQASYADLNAILEQLGLSSVDRVLLDLGLASDQLADEERGFAFDSAGPLDLRFDPTVGEPAWKLIEQLDHDQLTDLLRKFGEERFSGRIARRITERRPVRTAHDLLEAVSESVPAAQRRAARLHPATRVFQALRIAVNDELGHLERFLRETLPRCLSPGGRVVVISFHSLEDRLVKAEFRDEARWQSLTKRPVTPAAAEKKVNPRCRSAKLRAAVRTANAVETVKTRSGKGS